MSASAESVFEVGGIRYKTLTSNTVEVTSEGKIPYDLYSGVISIPSTFEFSDVTYTVTSIGESAFHNCLDLISIEIPSTVTSIGKNAFKYCSALTSISIPSSVDSIKEYAFSHCSLLASINIPSSVKSIGFGVFSGCDILSSVTLPSSITVIPHTAFSRCVNLTSISIPSTVRFIHESAFVSCKRLTEYVVEPKNQRYASFEGVLFNKDLDTLLAFPEGKSTHYTIPSFVKSIGDYAFYYCTGLTSISIPNSVVHIGKIAFGITGLTSIDLPNGVVSISEGSFSNCDSLISVTIPSSVTSIGYGAFFCCSKLKSIFIPSTVNNIGNVAFACCEKLTEFVVDQNNQKYASFEGVLFNKDLNTLLAFPGGKSTHYTIPPSVKSIGDSAFYYCTGLTSISIPNSVVHIGKSAFGITGLTSIALPNGVVSISEGSFLNCNSLISVTIPSSVTSIGLGAFASCQKLTEFVVDQNNQKYASFEGVLFNKDLNTLLAFPGGKSTHYTIPPSVKSIGDYAFYFCTGLTSISIPNSVVHIGERAFCNTGLTSIDLPNRMTSIGVGAFFRCSKLKSIFIPSSVTSIGDQVLRYCSELTEIHCQMEVPPAILRTVFTSVDTIACKLYVPIGSSSLYSQAVGWGAFTNIIEEAVTDVKEANATPVSVYADQHEMVIRGARAGEIIRVYALTGKLVKTIKATNEVRMQLPLNQVYLVKVTDQTFKVAL